MGTVLKSLHGRGVLAEFNAAVTYKIEVTRSSVTGINATGSCLVDRRAPLPSLGSTQILRLADSRELTIQVLSVGMSRHCTFAVSGAASTFGLN